ncbi:MAG: PAS domain S-box protein [Bryobacterales bacterium]|nr:PAS domain S-box protein [Bryobacterales bacterium]
MWLSPGITELLGYSSAEIRAMGQAAYPRLIHPEDFPKLSARYQTVRESGIRAAASFEARFATRSGVWRVLKCHEHLYSHFPAGGAQVVVGMAWDVTQSWQQQQQLRLQADLLQAVKQAVIVTNLDGRVTYWNTYAEQIYGYPAEEAMGQSIFDLTVDPAARAQAEQILHGQVAEHNVWRGTFHVRHRDGRLFPARVTNSAFQDENGKVAGFIGISEDISAEVAAQRALEESERRLTLFAKAANDALWEWDPETGRVWRNEAFSVLLGEPADNPDFGWWLERVHPDDRDRAERQFRDSLSGISTFHVKYRLRRFNGEYATVLDRAYVDRDADGRVRRVVGAITDITPLARAEEALQEQMEQFRRVFDEGPLGIALVDSAGRLVRVNPQLCQMLGFSSEELLAMSLQDLTHPEDLELTLTGVRQLFSGERPRFQVERRCCCKNGMLWVSITGTVLRSHDGTPRWMLGMVEDITERRAVDEQLRVARERAEAASAAKSAFLAQVSHEIRTPMNGLLGMLALLSTAGLTPEQQQLLDTAQKAGDGLLRIINDILDLTRYHHGKLVIQPSPCSLSQMLAELQALYRPQTEQKNVTFVTMLDPDIPPWVLADSGRLRQVLMNLLSNAFRFTDQGSVKLRVRCLDMAPLAVEFSISDTGSGIPEQALSSVFEAFSELSAETSRSIGGTGLGLAIVKQLVTLMGGVVQVQSTLGAGTRFWFTLPLEAAQPPPPTGDRKPAGLGKPLQGRRVLLVEDNLINQKVGYALLTGLGVDVEVAASGLDAVIRCQHSRYDLVLMDCTMPIMDGFEAARRIRALAGPGARVPIVALTALAFDEDRQRCLDAGMNDFLAKPVDRASLLSVIQQWL